MQDVIGTASKLHDSKRIVRVPQKSKCLTIAEAVKLHSFLREQRHSTMLRPSIQISSKKRAWARRQGEEESVAKGLEVNSTDKEPKGSDLNYLKELAAKSHKGKNQFSDLLLTKPYQFSFFAKYT